MSIDHVVDRGALTSQMYATEGPLAVRIQTHELYTQPPADFVGWVLDHVPWRGEETVLDIGCGAGAYLQPVCDRLTGTGRLLCGDLSLGMLRDVASHPLLSQVALLNADAAHLPLPDQSCDVVLANHMLYHVPETEQAVSEAHRVLRPGGYLLAAANSCHSMQALADEVKRACRRLGWPAELRGRPERRFSLENGRSCNKPVFDEVELHRLESALVFPTAEPAVAYVGSMLHAYTSALPDPSALLDQLGRQISSIVAEHGEFRVPKTTALFVARRAE